MATNDVGPACYLLALDNYIDDSAWVVSDLTKILLSNNKCITDWSKAKPSLIVTGTSLGDSLDKNLITFAKNINKPSVSIIEHWSWYKKRFELDGEMILPDHIIVNDEYAKEQAIADNLSENKIFIGGNPYLEKLSKMRLPTIDTEAWEKNNNVESDNIILFITESLKNSFPADSSDYLGYDEFEVLNDIIEILPESTALLIKTHPEEENEKYNSYQSNRVRIFQKMSLEQMIQVPDMIIGMASMLLIELAMFRDDIISYRPNARKAFIGEKIGATHYVKSKSQLKNYIFDPPILSSMPFRKKYEGSGKRISKFLHSLI